MSVHRRGIFPPCTGGGVPRLFCTPAVAPRRHFTNNHQTKEMTALCYDMSFRTEETDDNNLLTRFYPLLLQHAEEILQTPEMAECAVPAEICYGPMYSRLDLARLLQLWLTPGSPWVHRENGRRYYLLRAAFGVGGCCYGACGMDAESGELCRGLHPRGLDLLQVKPTLRRVPRRKAAKAPLQGLHGSGSSFAAWERATATEAGLRAYEIDETRQTEPPTLTLAELITHLLPAVPLIVNLPHTSAELPSSVRFLLPAADVQREARRAADAALATLLPPQAGVVRVAAPYSPLVADTALPESAEACIPARTAAGCPLRRVPSPAEREGLLQAYHRPHLAALAMHLRLSLRRHGCARLWELRSYPAADGAGEALPDICIGTAGVHTPAALTAFPAELCARYGYSAAVNVPYSASAVPAPHAGDTRVQSVLTAFNRRLYGQPGGRESLRAFLAAAAARMRA